MIMAMMALALNQAGAGIVTWHIDPTNSFIRLTIPDQDVAVTNVGNVKVQLRDANSTSQWTDAGGRRAALSGDVVTEYLDGLSVNFLRGSNNITVVETNNLRPNPADWSATTSNYTATTTAAAGMGARVRGTLSIFTFDMAYMAFRSLQLDITNTVPGPIVLTGGTLLPGSSTCCGIKSGLVDVDGLTVLTFGQPVPDVLHGNMSPMLATNVSGATIANVGALNRKLTYTINMPNLTMDLGGTAVSGSATGMVVATATISGAPEITQQPRGVTNQPGGSASFSVTAIGVAPLLYQWCKNGLAITNATNAALNLSPLGLGDGGSYSVIVSNLYGSVLSSNALLMVNSAPLASNMAVSLGPGVLNWRLSNSQLAPYVFDVEGDAVVLTNAISSTPGVSVAVADGYLNYTRPRGLTNDNFYYVVTDGLLNATARVEVVVAPVGSHTLTAYLDGASLVLTDLGTPMNLYDVLWSTNLAGWRVLNVSTAAPNGAIYYSEPATNKHGFYRLQSSMQNEVP